MERLTARNEAGEAYYKKCFEEPCSGMGEADCTLCDYYNETVCETLAAYEDLNLTPEQIKQFSGLYLEKCEEVNRLNDFEQSQCCKLLQQIAELKKQIPLFNIGDTAYIVDFDAGVIDESVVNGISSRIDKNDTEFTYDSDLLEFHSDDVGVIVFQSHGEAEEALER